MIDLAALLTDPTRADGVPVEHVPVLLAAAAAEHERLGMVERALLARWTGGAVAAAPPIRARALWLRVPQVAAEYGVAVPTVYDWIYKQRVTTKKLGAAKRAPVLVYRPDVERLARVRRALKSSLTG
jgi:hypothetical protein